MNHNLLPRPKDVCDLDGTFAVDGNTVLVLHATAGDHAFTAALQLQDELSSEGSAEVPILKAFGGPQSPNAIVLACGPEQAEAFELAGCSLSAPESVRAQAYSLIVGADRITLFAEGRPGLYYAVQTLRQLVRRYGSDIPALRIQDWPTLPYRGLMLDISRRKVPTLITLEDVVEELSHYKLNVLQLYTEHTFEFPSHPKIGAGCGSFSSQDIVELDMVCREHHVELMPNLQSFGHARNTLEIPEYRHLAETSDLWTLAPTREETYTLLEEMYGDMLPSFTSKMLNISCDETWDLGQGASKTLADEIGVGRVYLGHILRAREIAARYGCTIQIWGDILLHHPELITELPDDVVLLDWHYGPQPEYPTTHVFGDAGRRFWVCPGTGSWNSIFPRLYGSNVNVRNLIRDGVAAGAEGVLNTDWGDHGHYQSLGLSWYGYVFGAAQGWCGGDQSDEEFEAAFGPLFFGPDHGEAMTALGQLAKTNDLPGVHHSNRSHTILALFDEPLTGSTITGEDALPHDTLVQMELLGEEAAVACESLAEDHPRDLTLLEMALAGRLTAYAARKVSMGQEIRAALHERDIDGDSLYAYERELGALDVDLVHLCSEFEELWLARSRTSEIHVALGYFAELRARYRAVVDWLADQRAALAAGNPVDAELATYDTGDYRTLWQTWRRPG
jgi:hypothetical protein